MFLLALSFLFSGLLAVASKVIAEYDGGIHRSLAMICYYFTALSIAIPLAKLDKRVSSTNDAKIGIPMGLLGVFKWLTFLVLLQNMQGIVVFPVRNIGSLILTAGFSVVAWKEKLSKSQWLAILLSLIGVWLIY